MRRGGCIAGGAKLNESRTPQMPRVAARWSAAPSWRPTHSSRRNIRRGETMGSDHEPRRRDGRPRSASPRYFRLGERRQAWSRWATAAHGRIRYTAHPPVYGATRSCMVGPCQRGWHLDEKERSLSGRIPQRRHLANERTVRQYAPRAASARDHRDEGALLAATRRWLIAASVTSAGPPSVERVLRIRSGRDNKLLASASRTHCRSRTRVRVKSAPRPPS